jgi:hypothetical protein
MIIEEENEELKGSNEVEEARTERQLLKTRAPSKYFNEAKAPLMRDIDIPAPPSAPRRSTDRPPRDARQQPIVYEWQYKNKSTRPLTISSHVVHISGYLFDDH